MGFTWNKPFGGQNHSGSGPAPDDSAKLLELANQQLAKYQALGQQQQQQINQFADTQEQSVADYRRTLAANLANTAQQTFAQQNPSILEDLNARGLFTSQTARDEAQNRALQELATQQQSVLSDYDTSQYNNIQGLRQSGLSSLLGGESSGLDAYLNSQQAAIQRQYDLSDQQRQNTFASSMASKQSRDKLISSILGGSSLLGGQLGAAAITCFDPTTVIAMKDGALKEMKDVVLGDVLSDGSVVTSVRDSVSGDTYHNYKGVRVTGHHAVKEDGKWVRVKDSKHGVSENVRGLVRALGTDTHRLPINGIEFADEFETDLFGQVTLEQSLSLLNQEA